MAYGPEPVEHQTVWQRLPVYVPDFFGQLHSCREMPIVDLAGRETWQGREELR
jgi:hypothetical protein